jgi:hypothetical protein
MSAYIVIKQTPGGAHRMPRTPYFQVVDTRAGCTKRGFPAGVVANCREEAHAERIADLFNSGTAKESESSGDVPRGPVADSFRASIYRELAELCDEGGYLYSLADRLRACAKTWAK